MHDQTAHSESAPRHGRILIVDDEQDTANALAEILEGRGFITSAVMTGNDCLEQVTPFKTDVVLTDLMMPGMSGTELCNRLRNAHPDVLIIVLTGSVEGGRAALGAGAYDFLPKPICVAALEVALRRALAHRATHQTLLRQRALSDDQLRDPLVGGSHAVRTGSRT